MLVVEKVESLLLLSESVYLLVFLDVVEIDGVSGSDSEVLVAL